MYELNKISQSITQTMLKLLSHGSMLK